MNTSVIVVNTHHDGVLSVSVAALIGQQGPALDIIVPRHREILSHDLEMLQRWSQAGVIRFFEPRGQDRAAVYNEAAAMATGDCLLFIESHCIPEPDWAMRMTAGLEQSTIVRGHYDCAPSDHAFGRGVTANMAHTAARIAQRELAHCHHCFHAFGIRRSAWNVLGGLDPCAGTMVSHDLGYRAADAGHTTLLVPEAKVVHVNEWKQFSYMSWTWQTGIDRSRLMHHRTPDFVEKYLVSKRFRRHERMLRLFRWPATAWFSTMALVSWVGFAFGRAAGWQSLCDRMFIRLAGNSFRAGVAIGLRRPRRAAIVPAPQKVTA